MLQPLSRVQCVPKEVFDPGNLNGTYQALNGFGFDSPVKIMTLYNGSTTVAIDISLDGVTDHIFLPPLGTLIVDFQTNREGAPLNNGTLNVAAGQILYGKTAESPTYLQIMGYL